MLQHDALTPAEEMVERLWLASPDGWREGAPFDPWRHAHAMVMAGNRPCGTLPAALVVKR